MRRTIFPINVDEFSLSFRICGSKLAENRKYAEKQVVFVSQPQKIFECQKGIAFWSALFCYITTKILSFPSPPPVAVASAFHNPRAEVMVTGGGEAPLPLGAGAEVRFLTVLVPFFTHRFCNRA